MHYRGYERLRFDYRGRVLHVTIAGIGRMNPVDARMHNELATVFPAIQRDPDCDVVVLTGHGSGFCAGGDMKWFQSMIDDPLAFCAAAPEGKQITAGMLDLEKPLVCRLNGPAAGLGASMALMCDVIVADQTAMIGDPHVKVGLVPGDGGVFLWPLLIGFARARELLLTGEMITATEAHRIGLINHVVPAAELDAKVAQTVDRLLQNPRWAVRWTKAAINVLLRDAANKVNDTTLGYEMMANTLRDRQEAVSAFVEKRPPRYSGC